MQTAEHTALLNKAIKAVPGTAADLPTDERELFRSFCEAILEQLRAPFLARRGVDGLPVEILELFRMVRGRPEGGVLVQVQPLAGRSAVIRTCMPDQPFIVNTIRLLVRSLGGSFEAGFNAVIRVRRDAEGAMIGAGGDDGPFESMVQLRADGLSAEALAVLQGRLLTRLLLAQAMVEDFADMTAEVDRLSARFARLARRQGRTRAESFRETAEFLDWLLSDNFVFMGVVNGDTRLGFEREALAGVWTPGSVELPEENGDQLPLVVRKGTCDSPVHRAGRVDEIHLRVPDESGRGRGWLQILGLFTYRAVTQPSRNVPLLRRSLSQILESDQSRPGSWDYKGLANVFDSLPTEFLFTASLDEIRGMLERVRDAEREQEARVHLVQNLHGTNITFALAAMPKAQYSDTLRKRLERRLVVATGANYCDHGLFVGRFDTVLVHFYMTGGQALSAAHARELGDELTQMATPWTARVYAALSREHGGAHATDLIGRYGTAFPEEYTSRTSTAQTLRDVAQLESLGPARPVVADMIIDRKGRPNVRLYQHGDMMLTELLPVLAHFGLVIIDQYADSITPAEGPQLGIDTFRVRGAWGLDGEQIQEQGRNLCRAIEAVFSGRMENDSLNRLLLRAQLKWQEVDLIRAYKGYARQLGVSFPIGRIREILLSHPQMSRRLVTYFHARFDPDAGGNRAAAMAAAAEAIDDGLRRVSNHDEDLLLRSLYDLIKATLRTNFYRERPAGHYISFKILHADVEWMPAPRMMYEVYVHHAEMEGVHLRGGPIARGGIRWSDRADFRTEVLGLVATQMVKNTIIVPEGAKGGFLMKHVIPDYATRRAKADHLYTFLMRGLLDITDNIVDGEVVKPPRVVAHDGDDPYLVVAADKGTAHLSDTANGVAGEYGFWLGDAFASGGSLGYDHKKVGITARGAWVCVRRHFHESGLDPEKTEFTTVGIGDPSGDVFGNGVIEHRKMKLLAAFNHKHIFFDPNPDTEKTYAERLRLFREAKGWEAYDASLLSAGGGIFDRHAKSIPLSAEVKKMLGVLKDELPADAVLRLILRMPVELLWNGGIGTYVKASHETHRDADDHTNDGCRVNADELRCKSVGEGGNLGFTQAARIEFALKGGSANTDAVDNSGGVDMSDHEVNLKILLAPLVASGALAQAARNQVILDLTDEIADQVLEDNDMSGRQISLDRLRSIADPVPFGRAIDWVCRARGLTREFLKLPSDAVLTQRSRLRQGLTRPELAVIAAHMKLQVYKSLQDGDPTFIPRFTERVRGYFPPRVQSEFTEAIDGHMLHKAIGMTVVLNEVVADNGAAFFPTLTELTGRHPVEITGAYLRLSEALNLQGVRDELGASRTNASTRYQAWIHVADGVLGLLAAWLAADEAPITDEVIEGTLEIAKVMARSRSQSINDHLQSYIENLKAKGLSKTLATRCVTMRHLTIAREIALVRARTGDTARNAVVRYLAVGGASRLLPTVRMIEGRQAAGRWDPLALGILRRRYLHLLRDVVGRIELGPELRLGVERVAHKLYWGAMKDLATTLEAILGDTPDLGAFLVAEARARATFPSD